MTDHDADIHHYLASENTPSRPVDPVHLQATNWRHAFVLIVVAFLMQSCVFGYYIWSNTSHQNESDDITRCRARYATGVTVTDTANQIAFNHLVDFLTIPRDELPTDPAGIEVYREKSKQLRLDLARTGTALEEASAARENFEKSPTGAC